MFNGFPTYAYDEAQDGYVWQSSSRMQAIDTTDPANPAIIGDHEVPGDISDSRMVGDVLYLVTYENGWCWGCDSMPSTQVTSYDVSDPTTFDQVDQLRFTSEDPGWSKRSVAVTSERMYVAGRDWGDAPDIIQVVDISDAGGDLVLGAEVEIAGVIESRWQMDEYDGVLRVISQEGAWGSSTPPRLETFRIESAQTVTPLAQLDLVLPRPEDLRSVRFDGDRAYAITFERVDPLFTFDLSDPEAPRQVGELEIPGWVYHMEPRGDRIYGLGFDDVDGGALHVSLFDVSDLENPTQLDRVNFGGDWAHFSEDQDRIHKAFNLMLDQGLIAVPYAGWSNEGCGGRYESGIQLIDIDVETDDLVLRGVAPQIGQARRALLHRGYLFGVSDNAVQVFDIQDRGAPNPVAQLDVARNVQQVRVLDDVVLRFGNDWWTDRSLIDFTALDDADSAEPMGELDLSDAVEDEVPSCDGWWGRSGYWGSEVFVQGDFAYVPRHAYTHDVDGRYTQTLTFYVIDLSDRSAPRLAGTFEAAPTDQDEWLSNIVQTESALLVGRQTYSRTDGGSQYHYDVYDLRDPEAPTFTTRFEVPSSAASYGWGVGPIGCGMYAPWGWMGDVGGAIVAGDLVVSQHAKNLEDGTGRVRYYLDRLDVSDPEAPEMLPSVNIPGRVAHMNARGNRLVTLDYTYEARAATSWEDCAGDASYSTFDSEARECRLYRRRLNVLRVSNDSATLIDRVVLDGERISTYVAMSDERIFVLTREAGESYGPSNTEVETLMLADDGKIDRLTPVPVETNRSWWYGGITARGTRAFLSEAGTIHAIDTTDPDAPVVETHEMPGWSCQSLEVSGDSAYCAMGQQGVLTIPL